MDYNKYYLDQASGNYPVFRGSAYQRGYGLGNVFQRFFSWAIPFFKQHGLPIVKNVGKEVVHNIASIAKEAIDGRDIKESVEEKLKNSLEKFQKGKGIKRKNKNKRIRKKKIRKFRDIFQ